jgi:two-component system, sensor histidine kinase
MLNNLFRLAEDRTLVEQLRLLLRNVHSALVPTFILGLVLVWGLSNASNRVALAAWFFVLMLSKLNAALHASRNLKFPIPHDRARRLVWTLIGLNMADGMIWGLLPWITLSNTTMAGSILVISTMAAMVGSTMSRLSPVLPVFAAFSATMLMLVTSKVWMLGDRAYEALGAASIIYLVSLSLMARNSSRELRTGIELRFENIALIKQLQEKTRIAETAQREAELANSAKSKFLAAASHDLRQPIHAQGLFLEVLSRTDLTAYQRELLDSARSALEASVEMLNTLLDFSRIEAGVVEPQRQSLRLQTLLNKIENEVAPQADAKNLVYRTRETRAVVESDPLLLEMILRNLVTNAIRYTERGGVLVACRQRGGRAVLEVWDTGIGIAQAHHQMIFREFHQLGNPERDRNKGLGLGLAIAQGLARTLGHDLSLSSTPNRGSVFRIALPLARSQPVEQPLALSGNIRLLEVNVLVIDDDETVRTGMRQLLQGWGCVCDVAENIEEALTLTQRRTPGLIICDYRLREQRTGVEAIEALRAKLGEELPALLITGDTAPGRLREAQASGIPLLHKPVSPGQLYRKLVDVLVEAESQSVRLAG